MWKDKGLQLVMLPTTNSSNLGLYIDTKNLVLRKQSDIPRGESQYLYLLSDEEIKEGDWFIGKDLDGCNYVLKCDSIKDAYCYTDNKAKGGYGIVKKIIASNNPSLNLPQFPSSFLEEYVKRYNSKKSLEVEVKYESYWEDYHGRETNEESDFCYNLNRLKVNPDNTISILFKEEKKYSRSEVEELCGKAFDAGEAYRTGSCERFKQIHPNKYEWIKENLK